MKAYIAIKHYQDFRNKELVDNIAEALEQKGYETVCFIRDMEKGGSVNFEPAQMMQMVFEKISQCDLFVVDISEKGVGLGIASGLAYSKGIPVVVVAKNGSDIPTTLRGIANKVLFYDKANDIRTVMNEI